MAQFYSVGLIITYHLFVVWTTSPWTYKGERVGSFSLLEFYEFWKKTEDLSDVTVFKLGISQSQAMPTALISFDIRATSYWPDMASEVKMRNVQA